jgi:Na+-transporting methylmalonyl-CoA/oxaloacetate decarboxylase gamma subunit
MNWLMLSKRLLGATVILVFESLIILVIFVNLTSKVSRIFLIKNKADDNCQKQNKE